MPNNYLPLDRQSLPPNLRAAPTSPLLPNIRATRGKRTRSQSPHFDQLECWRLLLCPSQTRPYDYSLQVKLEQVLTPKQTTILTLDNSSRCPESSQGLSHTPCGQEKLERKVVTWLHPFSAFLELWVALRRNYKERSTTPRASLVSMPFPKWEGEQCNSPLPSRSSWLKTWLTMSPSFQRKTHQTQEMCNSIKT